MTGARLIELDTAGSPRREVPLGARATIGRAPMNTLVISDRELSKSHAELVLEGEGYIVRDLGSSNGTFVNGERIKQCRLEDGDLLYMGASRFRFVAGSTSVEAPVAILPKSPIDKTTVIAAAKPDAELSGQRLEDRAALRRAYDRVHAAFAAVRSLLATTDLRQLCDKILDVAFELLDAETGALLLFDEQHQLVPWAHKGARADGERIVISRTIVDEVLRLRTAVLASDALTDARFGSAQSIVMSGLRSLMCVPLASGDNVYGILHVGNAREVGAFEPSDLELMSGIGAGAGIALSNAFLTHQLKEEAQARVFLGRFLSPVVVEQVMERKVDLKRGGHEAEVTVMFADIRGFTSLTERSPATEIVRLLNEYFDQMAEVVFRHDGVLDKFIGDALMAVWGAPLSSPKDAARAIAAALEMQEVLRSYNDVRRDRGEEPVAVGIGLASGRCVSGVIGAQRRLEYTVIGDAVNLASRLAGVAHAHQILCDEETFRRAKNPKNSRALPPTEVKGKTKPVAIYELLP